MDLDSFIVATYVLVDDWWHEHRRRAPRGPGRPASFSTSEVLALAVLSQRPRFVEGGGEVVLSGGDAKELLEASPGEAVGTTVAVKGTGFGDADAAAGNAGGNANAGRPQPDPKPVLRNLPDNLPEEISREAARGAASGGRTRDGGTRGTTKDARVPGPAPEAGKEYEVVGVAGSQPVGIGPAQPSTSYVTTRDALDLSGSETVGQILASAENAGSVEEAKAAITSDIKGAHGGQQDFSVVTQEDLLSALTEITDQLNVFLVGIAGISLLVGGIGIMNIMLVSVTERTREIGIRKALGATDADVLLQFLFEAVLLAVLGGLAGVALGIASSVLLPDLLPDLPRAAFGTTQIALAFGVAALIGVLFGSLPAYRSARRAPVEALRRE